MKAIILFLVASITVAQAYNAEELHKIKKVKKTVKALSDVTPTGKEPRIISGQTATRGLFPHQVAIFADNSLHCGGSLISTEWVLTAAQCVDGISTVEIYLGANDLEVLEDGRETIVTSNIIIHEDYSSQFNWNDIAVIGLGTSVTPSEYIQPLRLPTTSLVGESFETNVANISGWGSTNGDSGAVSPTLQYGEMTVISNMACLLDYGDKVVDGTLCALGSDGQEPCYGDGGGALVLGSPGNYTQIGIDIFHSPSGCGTGQAHGFTRVTEYLSWISANIGIPNSLVPAQGSKENVISKSTK